MCNSLRDPEDTGVPPKNIKFQVCQKLNNFVKINVPVLKNFLAWEIMHKSPQYQISYCFPYISATWYCTEKFCTPDGAMGPTFQMNYVQAF